MPLNINDLESFDCMFLNVYFSFSFFSFKVDYFLSGKITTMTRKKKEKKNHEGITLLAFIVDF